MVDFWELVWWFEFISTPIWVFWESNADSAWTKSGSSLSLDGLSQHLNMLPHRAAYCNMGNTPAILAVKQGRHP